MKKSGFIIAVLLTLCSMSAMAQMPSGVDTLKLDKVNWRITYTGKVINDTTQETPIYRQAEMRLDIGDKVTYFYNQSYMLWEKQVLEMIKSGGDARLGDCARQHGNHHRLHLPTGKDKFQGTHLVGMVQ